jgi:colicin import membrane protein
MSENPAPSYLLSAALHGGVVALCVLLAYLAEAPPPQTQKIFELVAGEGNNYGATEAPALGVPGGSSAKMMTVPIPPPPTPPAPQAEPAVEPAPITPAPVPVKPVATPVKPKPAPTIPDYAKTVARTANRTEARIEAKEKKKLDAEAKRLAAAQKQQMTYDQYLKEHGGEGIAGGVVGGSTANKVGGAGGKAMTREEGSLLEAYFALLQARLKANYSPPPDASDSLTAHVKFFVSADGSISNVEIDRPSGNVAFDESLREAFRKIRAGVGSRPDHRGDQESFTFSMKENDGN